MVEPVAPVQPVVGWKEIFRRHELEVRLEMGAAQLSNLARLVELPSPISPADLYRISTTHRHAKWLIANLSALSLGGAEEAVKAFEGKAAKALRLPRLIDEREALAATVEDLEGTAEDLRGKVQELNAEAGRVAARITQMTAEERRLDEQLVTVGRITGLSRSQVLDQLREFERSRAEADRLSNLAGTLNKECWKSQSDLDLLRTKIDATQKELRALQGMKDVALDELGRKLTLSQAYDLWCRLTLRSFTS